MSPLESIFHINPGLHVINDNQPCNEFYNEVKASDACHTKAKFCVFHQNRVKNKIKKPNIKDL